MNSRISLLLALSLAALVPLVFFAPVQMAVSTSASASPEVHNIINASTSSQLARGQQPLASGVPALTDWGIGVLLIGLMLASLLSFRRAFLARRWPDDALNSSGHRPYLDRRLL